MSKSNMIYMCLAALTLSGVIVLASITYDAKGGKANAAEITVAATETTENSPGYVLKEYEGGLALFRENSEKPYKILDADVSTMSEYDLELLKKGIVVDTEKELNSLIEDYTS